MGNAGMGMEQGAHFSIIDLNTMRSQDFRFQQTLFLHLGHNRHTLFAAHVLHFKLRFLKCGSAAGHRIPLPGPLKHARSQGCRCMAHAGQPKERLKDGFSSS